MKNLRRKSRAKPKEIFHSSAISKRALEFFPRIISFFLILVFVWSQVLPADTAWAFQEMTAGFMKAPAYERIVFPDFARVEWANTSVNVPRGVVYLFQDAHTSLLAQQRITQTLLELRKQGAIDAVLVEGAAGRLTADRFDAHPGLKKTPELIENLEKQGYLHGAAAFYVLRPDTTVEGLETPGLYRENRQAFRDVFAFRDRIDPVTERFKVEWQRWLQGHMDEASRTFFLNAASRHTDAIEPAYFQQLLRMASEKAGISWSIGDQAEWPQLIRVQRMLEIQPRLRMDEARAAFKDLRKILPGSFKEKLDFIQMRIDGGLKGTLVQEDATLYRDFAAQLMTELVKQKRPMLSYGAFYDWLACETFRQEIQAEDLALEIERLEDRIWKAWFQNPEDRGWMALGRLGVLLAKASRLELSRGEVRQFSRALEAKAFEAWIGKFLPEEKETFEKFSSGVLSFYKLAESREQGFVARLSETLEALSSKNARTPHVAVVTGGYHKIGLLNNLKSQGLRVAVVTPVLERVDQNVAYLYRMLETTPEASTLSIVPAAVVGSSELRGLVGDANAERSERRVAKILDEASTPGTPAATVRKAVPTEFRWKSWIRWILTAFILLFSSRGLSQEAPASHKAELAELNRIAGQGFNVNRPPVAERPAMLFTSGRLNSQSFVWGKGLGAGGKNLGELARMNPEARRVAIQALLQNELRGRYLSIGLDIKTSSSSTKATDLIHPSPLMLGFLKLRAATEALEWLLSAAPQNAADEAYAQGWRLEWEAQVKNLEAQAYATVIQIQKLGAKIDLNTRILKLLEISLPQARVREDPKNRLESPGTALNVEMKLRMLQVRTRDLMRQRQTLRAELGFLLGVSAEAISLDSVGRLPVPLLPISWKNNQRENFSNAVLGSIPASLRLRSREMLALGASEAATAEGRRGWFHLPQVRISGLTAEQAGGEAVPGWTPERRKANLEGADQEAALEVAQAQVALQARKGLDGIWMGLDQEQASEEMLAKYWADWQQNSLTFHSSNAVQMNLLGNMQELGGQLIDARVSVSETVVGFVGLGILDPATLGAAPISPNLYSRGSSPRSEVRTWIKTVFQKLPLLFMAGFALFLASCATGPRNVMPPHAAKMEWKAPAAPRHMNIEKYKEPALPLTGGVSDGFYGDLLPPKADAETKARILASTPLAETSKQAKQDAPKEIKVEGPGKNAWDASDTVKTAPEKPAAAPKSETAENAALIKTLLDTAKVLDAYHFQPGETRDALLQGEPIKKFQDALVAAAPLLAGLDFVDDPLHTKNRGSFGKYTYVWLKKVMGDAPQILALTSGTPAETKTAQAPAPKAEEHLSKGKTHETEAQRDEAINKAVAAAASPSTVNPPAMPEKIKTEKTSPAGIPAVAETPTPSAQRKTPLAQTPPKAEDLSGDSDSDFVFEMPEIKMHSAKLGDGPSGGFVIKAFSAGEVRTSDSGGTQTWSIEDPIRANAIKNLFDLLKTDLGQLAGMDSQSWAPYELLMQKLKAAEEKIQLARALQNDEELGHLETGRFVETGHVYAEAGSVNAGDPVIEAFPDSVVGVETTVPLWTLIGHQLHPLINEKPAAILGSIQVLKIDPTGNPEIDPKGGPTAVIHFAAQPADGGSIEKDAEFNVELRFAKTGGIQEGEPVNVELGDSGTLTPAARAQKDVPAPEDGFFKVEGPGHYQGNVHLASRRDGAQVLANESWQSLLSDAQSLVNGAAEMLQRMSDSGVGSDKVQAFQNRVHDLSQILTGIGQSTVRGGNGFFSPDPQATALPAAKGASLGTVYSDSVFIGSKTDPGEMFMVPKGSAKVGDLVRVTGGGEVLTGKVSKIIEEIPAEPRDAYKDLDAVVVEVESPASQIIVWPKGLDLPLFGEILRKIREQSQETSQYSPEGAGFHWIAGPAGFGEECLLASVGKKATGTPSVAPSIGPRSAQLASTDSRPIVTLPDPSSPRVREITAEHSPGRQIEKFNKEKGSMTDPEFRELFERGSVPLVFEMSRFLLAEKHDWAPAMDSLRALSGHAGKDGADVQRAGAIELAIVSVLYQRPANLSSDLMRLKVQSREYPEAQAFIDSVFLYILQKEGIHSQASQAFLGSGYFTLEDMKPVARAARHSADPLYKTLGAQLDTFRRHEAAAREILDLKLTPDVAAATSSVDPTNPFKNLSPEKKRAAHFTQAVRRDDVLMLQSGRLTSDAGLGAAQIDPSTAAQLKQTNTNEASSGSEFKLYPGSSATGATLGEWDTVGLLQRQEMVREWASQGRFYDLTQALRGLGSRQPVLTDMILKTLSASPEGRLALYAAVLNGTVTLPFSQAYLSNLIKDAAQFTDLNQSGTSEEKKDGTLSPRSPRFIYIEALLQSLKKNSADSANSAGSADRNAVLRALAGLVPHGHSLRALEGNLKGVSADTDRILQGVPEEDREGLRKAAINEEGRRAVRAGANAVFKSKHSEALGEARLGSIQTDLGILLADLELSRAGVGSVTASSAGEFIETSLSKWRASESLKDDVRKASGEALGYMNGQARPDFDPKKDYYMGANFMAWLSWGLGGLGFYFVGWLMNMYRLAHKREKLLDSRVEKGLPVHSFPSLEDWRLEFQGQINSSEFVGYENLKDALQRWMNMLATEGPLSAENLAGMRVEAERISRDHKLKLGETMLRRYWHNDRIHNRNMMHMVAELSMLTMERLIHEGAGRSRNSDFIFHRDLALKMLFLKRLLFTMKNLRSNRALNVIEPLLVNDKEIDRISRKLLKHERRGWKYIVRPQWALNWMRGKHNELAFQSLDEYARVAERLGERVDLPGLRTILGEVLDTEKPMQETRLTTDDNDAFNVHRRLKSRMLNLVSRIMGIPGLLALGISIHTLGFGVLTCMLFVVNIGLLLPWINYLAHVIGNMSGAEGRHFTEGILKLQRLKMAFDAASPEEDDATEVDGDEFLPDNIFQFEPDPSGMVPALARVQNSSETGDPGRAESRVPVTLMANSIKTEMKGKKEYWVAVFSRAGQEEAFDALMRGIGSFALKELSASAGGGEDVKKGKENRLRETLAAVKEQGNVRLHIDKESGRLAVADLGIMPLREKKRALIFGLGIATQLYGQVTSGGTVFNHFPGFSGLAFQVDAESSRVIFSDLPIAEKTALPSGNAKPSPKPALTAAVVAATLIIFLGILPLGAGAYAATLARKAFEAREALLQPDLNALVARAPKESLALLAPKADANYTLFLEAALLKGQETIEPLTRLPYKVVVVFNEVQKKEYMNFVARLGGTKKGSFEIRLGKVEEVVRLSVGRPVQEDNEEKMQFAFAGSDEKVLRHLRPYVGNLIHVDGETLVPGEWLLDAFQSLYVFNLGKIRKDFIWSIDTALPILLEQTLAIQRIAHAA